MAALAGLVQLLLSGAYQQGLAISDVLGDAALSVTGGRDLLALLLLVGGLAVALAAVGTTPAARP